MDSTIDLTSASKALDLSNIRFQLIRLEDTITFTLIERVQFPLNATIYKPGAFPSLPDSQASLFDWIMSQQEHLHSLVRRYDSPDEYPFFPSAIVAPLLKPLNYPAILHPNDVNVNPRIKAAYISNILPALCASNTERVEEQQENYGSAATTDVLVLQALSRRIHFGKFVAESKFLKETERFVKLIKAEDREGIDVAITDSKVEQMVLDRLKLKAKTYGTDPATDNQTKNKNKIDADEVMRVYKEMVIPLTKDVEVEYLMQRLKGTEWE